LWDNSLSSLFAVNADALTAFFKNTVERKNLLAVALAANTDPERGGLMHKYLILPYLDRRFRNSYRYAVTVGPLTKHRALLQSFNEFTKDKQFVADNYDVLSEVISYSSHQGIANSNGFLEIHLDFTRVQLERSFQSGEVFFRELIQVDEELEDLFFAHGNANELVSRLFNFTAQSDGGEYLTDWQAAWIDESAPGGKRYLKITVQLPEGATNRPCEVRLNIIQERRKPFFLMQIGEPSWSPTLIFEHEDEAVEVIDFPFFPVRFNRNPLPQNEDIPPHGYVYSLNDAWIFPRSGVLFAWKPRGSNELPAFDARGMQAVPH
jgi:hypothetical protein